MTSNSKHPPDHSEKTGPIGEIVVCPVCHQPTLYLRSDRLFAECCNPDCKIVGIPVMDGDAAHIYRIP